MIFGTSSLPRLAAIALSASAHAALAFAVGGHGAASSAPSAMLVEIGAPELVSTPIEEPAPAVVAPAPRAAIEHHAHFHTHTHDYPVPPDHDEHPHDPSLDHAPFAPAAPAAPAVEAPSIEHASSDAPVRFTMTVANAAIAAGPVASAPNDGASSSHVEETIADDEADARPVLVAGAAPSYPLAAAAAWIEVDVPIAIVIGVDGRVLDARAPKRFGFGLDESALEAVRGYRFSAPRRHGRAVRVRMTWTVLFRLR